MNNLQIIIIMNNINNTLQYTKRSGLIVIVAVAEPFLAGGARFFK